MAHLACVVRHRAAERCDGDRPAAGAAAGSPDGVPAIAAASRWRGRCRGLTLLELMLGLLIIGILFVIGSAQYANYQERALVNQAITEIAAISLEIEQMAAVNGSLPADLAEVGHAGALDPWGRAYIYTDLTGPGNGAARKDRRLNPLNSDFDLFSVGKNGVFKPQISHRDSLDDVIRASDGRFINLAEKY